MELTNEDIESLRNRAKEVGDNFMMAVCDMAWGVFQFSEHPCLRIAEIYKLLSLTRDDAETLVADALGYVEAGQ